MLLMAAPTLHALNSCDVKLRLDAVTVSSNFSAVGFPPLTTNLQNPAIYFSKKVETEVRINNQCYVCHEQGYRVTSDFREYNPLTGAGPTLTAWSGSAAYHSETNGETSFDCQSQRIGPSAWTDPACAGALSVSGEVMVSNRTETSYTLVVGREEHELLDTPRGTAASDASERSRLSLELFDPLTLDAFVTEVADAVQSADWPDWSQTTAPCSERGGRNVITWINDDRAEFNAALTKLKYRIMVRGPNGQKRSVSWIERFTPNGGGPFVDNQFTAELVCNGKEQFLPATGSENGRIVPPPESAGKIEVFLVAQWSCQQDDCGPGQGRASAGSVFFQISLGKTLGGDPAGFLAYHEEMPAPDLASARRLQLLVDPSVEIIRDGATLRQLAAPQTLVLFVPRPQGLELRFHIPPSERDVNGYYQPNSQPQATWVLEQPDADPQRLRVIQVGPSGRLTNAFDWQVPEQAWSLTLGTWRKEMRTTVINGDLRRETFTIRALDNQLAYQQTRTWRDYGLPLGERLIQEELGAGASAWTTRWTYHEAPSAPMVQGKLASVTRPDGSHESYEYDHAGRLTRIVGPFTETADGRLTEFSYEPLDPKDDGAREPGTPRTVVERVMGHEIRRRYTLFLSNETQEIRCARPNAPWNAPDNLLTTKRTIPAPNSDAQRECLLSPDGTLQVTERLTGRGRAGTEITATGAPDGGRTDVIDGLRTTRQFDEAGRIRSLQTHDIRTGAVLASKRYTYPDAFGHPTEILDLNGRSERRIYDCCHLVVLVDRDGIETRFDYDPLGRLASVYRSGLTERYGYDAADNLSSVRRQGTNGTIMTLRDSVFDTSGREVRVSDGLSRARAQSFLRPPSGGLIHVVTLPDGGQRRIRRALDGAVLQVDGTGAIPMRFEYGVELLDGIPSLFAREIRLHSDGSDTGEWTTTYEDFLGRPRRAVRSDDSSRDWTYNAAGQLRRERDYDGIVTLYAYNERGEREYTALDLDASGNIELAGMDRVVRTVREFAPGHARERTFLWPYAGLDTPLLVQEEETAFDGQFHRLTRFGLTTTVLRQSLGQGIQTVIEQSPDETTKTTRFVDGVRRWEAWTGSRDETLRRNEFTYDAHGRLRTLNDGTGLTRTFDYDAADQPIREFWPSPGGDSLLTLTRYYDPMGRVLRRVFPDGTSQTNEYQPSGLLVRASGARLYPVELQYDSQGRLLRQTRPTAAGFSSDSWRYNETGGWLEQQTDAAGAAWSYLHSPEGRLLESLSSRGLVTQYRYDGSGELLALTRDVPEGPSLILERTRLGWPARAWQGTNALEMSHSESGRLLAESGFGWSVTNVLDANQRPISIRLRALPGSGQLARQDIAYDGASRFASVSSSTIAAHYRYGPYSSRIAEVRYLQNGALRMLERRSYDSSGHLRELTFAPVQAPPLVFRYQHNAADQCTRLDGPGARWDFLYDRLGQLISARASHPDGASIAGQQFEYTYDESGSRTSTGRGGNTRGLGLRQAAYTPSALLQYHSRDIPGALDIFGVAPASARVLVNQQPAQRQESYFYLSVPADLSAAAELAVLAEATLAREQRQASGRQFLPRHPEEFSFDADGNMVRDGRWTYTWNANNQLVQLEAHASLPDAARVRLVYSYDPRGRRVTRVRWRWAPEQQDYADREAIRFAYDGWRLMAERTENDEPLRSYVWGPDLSGTLDEAGGMGGLIAIQDHVHGRTYFCAHDAAGHVRALVDAEDGSVAARYDYGPFGEPLRSSGPAAAQTPLRFATKYVDLDSGFIDFGHRWYDPSTGRWLSRDPLGQPAFAEWLTTKPREPAYPANPARPRPPAEFAPPYLYARNDPLNAFDPTGLDVAYLLDADAFGRNGHAALLVGDDQKGWLYFSFGAGRCQMNPFGGNLDNLDVQRFRTFAEARSSAKLATFDRYLRWHTLPENDQEAVKTARGYFNSAYNLFTCNCDDMVIDSIRSADIEVLDRWRPVDTFNVNRHSAHESGPFLPARTSH
jgi:RHS repeat-associated protein